MASQHRHQYFHRIPQNKTIDSLCFLSPISPFSRFIALATSSPSSSTIEIHSLTLNPNSTNPTPQLTLQSSIPSPSRITSLKSSSPSSSSRIPVAFSTFSGSLSFLYLDAVDGSVDCQLSLQEPVHRCQVSGLDLAENGGEAVSVAMDGRVNVVAGVGDGGRVECRRVGDSKWLVGYSAVRWGSAVEFATGGLGFGVQWWDLRRPGGFVSQMKGNW